MALCIGLLGLYLSLILPLYLPLISRDHLKPLTLC